MREERGKQDTPPQKKTKRQNQQKEINILESALKVFGEKGFEATTVSAISKEAGISEPTLYEYFDSKEDVLFSIPALYTRREVERMKEVEHYIHSPSEKIRMIIQSYLEFYERNPLYTSVALLTLKGSRNFMKSPAYEAVREAARSIVTVFNEGVAQGVFRDDIDGYLVRNMVLGFIEHLTIQWLLTGRPQRISEYRDIMHEMVMRAIEKEDEDGVEVKLRIEGLNIPSGKRRDDEPEGLS
jgi:TetR/AcrR family transcriptional regulator, fatty acid metabolism regulator protein